MGEKGTSGSVQIVTTILTVLGSLGVAYITTGSTFDSKLAENSTQISEIKKAVNEFSKQIDDLEKAVANTKNSNDQVNEKIQITRNSLNALETRASRLQSNYDALRINPQTLERLRRPTVPSP